MVKKVNGHWAFVTDERTYWCSTKKEARLMSEAYWGEVC